MPIKQPCQKAGGATGLSEESASPAELLKLAPSKIARVLAYLLPESSAIELPQIEEIPTTKPDKGFKAVAA